jgi:hypothetical protein
MSNRSEEDSSESWLYRGDYLTSKIMHVRFARLHDDVLEMYKGDHLEIEDAFTLTSARVYQLKEADCEVKPPGVGLLKGYVSGQIESRRLVRAVQRCNTHSGIHLHRA